RAAIKQLIDSNPTEAGAIARSIVSFVRESVPNNPDFLGEQMETVSTLCGGDVKADDATGLAQELRGLVSALKESAQQTGEQNSAMLASALGCAGSPAIVAVDPELYSLLLVDAAQFASLVRAEPGSALSQLVNFARQTGFRPNNNQIPTITQSVD
ncbi:MAG: hypothetical protein EBZ69_07915, partial [Alphaproteobacteria bacterium]|nr:hypothetical protein [Alphaproteobacteria bacterium]